MRESLLACLLILLIASFLLYLRPRRKRRVVIAGCARNVERELKTSLPDVLRLAKEFDEYAILIYENDSEDGTVEELRRFQQKEGRGRVHVFSDTGVEGSRTVRLARGRNLLLAFALRHFGSYDYLVVMDLDYTRNNTRSLLAAATSIPDDCSASTATSRKEYYDWWAFREESLQMNYDCWKDEEATKVGNCVSWGRRWGKRMNEKRRRVASAFNGIAIYRMSHIPPSATYVGKTKEGEDVCEHVSFNLSLPMRVLVDPNLVTSTWDAE